MHGQTQPQCKNEVLQKGKKKKKSNNNNMKKQKIPLEHFLGPQSKFIFHDYKINVNSSQEIQKVEDCRQNENTVTKR